MRKILVTGAAGFIGSTLIKRLLREGDHVIALDSLTAQVHGEDPDRTSPTYRAIKADVEFHRGDVRDRKILEALVGRVDAIVHLAAETGTGQSMYAVTNYCDVNITGTAALMDTIAASRNRPQKIMLASSRAIYGEGKYTCRDHGTQFPDARAAADMQKGIFDPLCGQCRQPLSVVPTTEDAPAKPQSIYGITKAAQEQILLMAASSQNVPAIALRLQNVYGPGQSLSNPYTGILSIFSTRARADKNISIFEDGLESRDFVFVDDVVEAFVRGLKSESPGSQAINVGSGHRTTVQTVVDEILQFFESKSESRVSGEFRVGDIRHNVADLAEAERVLGFKPTVDFRTGLKSFLEWAQGQDSAQDLYEKSLDELRQRGLLK